ncbi:hypothetical protein P3W24_03830 [Luteibacter sp. PPL201]|uniref:DUF4760 domain-containing protein n=1 Tax=Luteibacter sahnii TaxID=3021977 RepID=A0ABT6B7U3_9GAMM
MTGSDAAAWVQAVGSVAAIVAAGLLPLWHERCKRKAQRQEWLSNLTALAFEVRDMAMAVAKAYRSEDSLYATRMGDDADEYAPLLEALGSFPSYALTDRLHLIALLHLRRFASHGDQLWRAAVSHGEALSHNWEAKEQAGDLAEETVAFVEGVAAFK